MKTSYWILISMLMLSYWTIVAQENDTMPDAYFYTYHQTGGNRIVEGQGTFPQVETYDIQLDGTPVWVIGDDTNTTVWHVALADGSLQIIEIRPVLSGEQEPQSVGVMPGWFAPGQPIMVGASGTEGAYVIRSGDVASTLTHPVPYGDTDLLYISQQGELVLARETGVLSSLALNTLPDARIVISDTGLIAVYTDATEQRYVHGVLGDRLEAASLSIIAVEGSQLHGVARVDLPGEDVFEGLAPIWADVNEDGTQDLIATVSNSSGGAQLRAYTFDGRNITQQINGPAIGQGNRWRHQLAWGAFGTNGENELVSVLTPHIGGVVEYFRIQDGALVNVANEHGFTSHVINTRNLDMAVAGDFNGDGQLELAIPNQQRDMVAGIQRNENGASPVWTLPVDGQIVTNLSVIQFKGGELGLAIGTSDNRLRIWLPES